MSLSTTGATTSSGQSSKIDIRQPYAVTNYVIKLTGTPPTNSLSQSLDYVGGVYMFGGFYEPEGYAFCDGRTLSASSYPELYQIIGNTYGGDTASGSFALPDLRGRTPIGAGSSPGSGMPTITPGMQLGQPFETLLAVPEHDHQLSNGGTIAPSGSNSVDLNLLMPSLGLTAVISTEGIYPSRSINSDPVIGDISWFAGDSIPKGYLPADGRTLSINENQALFSLLGTTYGGNGRTTFSLPDLRGRVAIQANSQHPLGQVGGSARNTLNLHSLTSHDHSLTAFATNTTATGSGQAVSLMQPYLSVNYVVPFVGRYPSRAFQSAQPHSRNQLSAEPTMGGIGMTARTYPSMDMAFATGQTFEVWQNTALFSIFGTTYGGDGRTTFNLPNFAGRTPIGAGSNAGMTYLLGQEGGNDSITLTTSQLPTHLHQFSLPVSATVEPNASSVTDEITSSQAVINNGTLTSAGQTLTNHGVLMGSGTVNGDLTNHGTLSPGHSPGTLSINGSLQLMERSTLIIELAGSDDQHDRIKIHGSAHLDGDLDILLIDGFRPEPTDTFTIAQIDHEQSGRFHDFEEGDVVFQTEPSDPASAFRISYRGGDGNDIELYGTGTRIQQSDRHFTDPSDPHNHWIYGSQNDSLLRGGAGEDKLSGGAGNNVMEGGEGPDTFIITHADSHTVILDFDAKADRILLSPLDHSIDLQHHNTYTAIVVNGRERAIVYGDHQSLRLHDATTLL